jgi:hypothetical protein
MYVATLADRAHGIELLAAFRRRFATPQNEFRSGGLRFG